MREIYSSAIVNKVKEILENDHIKYYFEEEKGVFHFSIYIRSRMNTIYYAIGVRQSDLSVYAMCPFSVDCDNCMMMKELAEFICKANYGIKNGNFEIDYRDGEIRYKCFLDYQNIVPTTEMIRNSIHCPAAMFECYGEGIIQIIFNNISAVHAINLCE